MPTSPRHSTRVLVVEDDSSLRDLLRAALSDEGYDVLLASDGAAALDLLRRGTPHTPGVILTDTIMPRMGGWDFVRAYRRLPPPHAPIISIGGSGPPPPGEVPPAVDAVLPKPFDLDQLLLLIARCTRSAGPTAGRET